MPRLNPSMNADNSMSTLTVDHRYGPLQDKHDNQTAAWTVNSSEMPLTEACDVPAASDWADSTTLDYHSRHLGHTPNPGFPSHQWTHQLNDNRIPVSLATDYANLELPTGVVYSSAPDMNFMLASTSSSIHGPHYAPILNNDLLPDTSITSYSPLTSTSTTASSYDLTPPGLLTPATTGAMHFTYPQTTTAFEEYQSLMYPMTSGPVASQSTAVPSVAFPIQDGFPIDRYGYVPGHVLETPPAHEDGPSYVTIKPEELRNDLITPPHDHSEHHHDLVQRDPKKPAKKGAMSIRKTVAVEKKPKNQVSLQLKAGKSAPVSRQTSCWRCRRYKKPCNGKGSVCDACVTSGFRIWSSDIGCRRGGMDDFINMLIPVKADTTPIVIDSPYLKPVSFRQSAQIYPSEMVIPSSASKGDPWDQFLYKIQSTGIHGPGVLELLQIAIDFQRKLKKPDKVIVSAARAMSIAADMFRLFVATRDSDTFQSATNLATVFLEARKVLVAAAAQFLKNCLTGRIKQWFPAFMSSNMNVFAYILVGDAIASIPPQHRTAIWPDVRKTLMDLRMVLYPTARDLMNALSKGSQPLNMSCWETIQNETGSGWIRNPEGMRLVDDCEATFDAMRALQLWRERFLHFLCGDSWMSTKPLEVDLLLISSVSRLFVTPKS